MKHLKINKGFLISIILLMLCFFLYWKNIGNYTFLDTDETRFVSIAKSMLSNSDWINIRLDEEDFLNYSPLIFWFINLSCFAFEKISAEVVRFPIALISTIGVILLFSALRNLLSKSYAFIIALIFATSLGTLVFSRLATTDILFSVFAMGAILCTSKTLFSRKNKQKIIMWCLTYLFIALSTMTCGILGFIIPTISIFAMYIFTGNIKELFLQKHIIPGLIIFSSLTLPWHILMIEKHGINFISEYLSICNFTKYTGIKETITVITTFLVGFLPWSFSFVWIISSKAKEIKNTIIEYKKDSSQDKWIKLKTTEKFLTLNTIVFFVAFIFAILYGTKCTYTILFLLFPASCITGFYWYEYIVKKEHDNSIFISTFFPNILLILCSLVGLFGHNFLNTFITQSLGNLIVPLIVIFFIIPIFGIFSVLLKGRIPTFISNIILMISISFVLAPSFFNFLMLNGGENDLISFANLAHKEKVKLTAFISSKKHSITYYYEDKVNFKNNKNYEWLKKYLQENPNDYVIVEIKDLWDIEKHKIPYLMILSGKRYCLIQYLPSGVLETTDEKEPEVIVY